MYEYTRKFEGFDTIGSLIIFPNSNIRYKKYDIETRITEYLVKLKNSREN